MCLLRGNVPFTSHVSQERVSETGTGVNSIPAWSNGSGILGGILGVRPTLAGSDSSSDVWPTFVESTGSGSRERAVRRGRTHWEAHGLPSMGLGGARGGPPSADWTLGSGPEQQVGEAQQASEQTDADRLGAGPDADTAGHAMTQPHLIVRGVKINRQLEVRRGRLGGEWMNADFPAGRVRESNVVDRSRGGDWHGPVREGARGRSWRGWGLTPGPRSYRIL